MVLALLGMVLLSVQVCSAYMYTIDLTLNPSSVYVNTPTTITIHAKDMDHSDWVFPYATGTISISHPSLGTQNYGFDTNATGWVSYTYQPIKTGNYTFTASSSYDYNTTPYIPVGIQYGVSYPVKLPVIYRNESIGVFRNSHDWYLDADGNGVWDGASIDTQLALGKVGDIPVLGDWNGNGITEIGVFRDNHTWNVDYNGNGIWDGIAGGDRIYITGKPGDIPVPGDWNGNGITEMAVFRDSHTWYIDYNGNGIWDSPAGGDRIYTTGQAGDKPVFGDWNADGKTEMGVFRPSNHLFYLDVNGNGLWDGASVDLRYDFGTFGDIPVSGTWGRLNTPVLVSPSDGSSFSNFPRWVSYSWNPVIGASGYQIQIQYYGSGNWYNLSTTTVEYPYYMGQFVGMNPGRWRVTALDGFGRFMSSMPSSWWGFTYTV